LIYPDHATRYLNSQAPATRSVLRTFTKSARAKINAAPIWFPMRSPSVVCGTVSRMQSRTQSATPSFSAAHIMLWFAFTMQRATWSTRTSTRAISKSCDQSGESGSGL